MVYQDLQSPGLLDPQRCCNFEILLVKIFSPKQNENRILPAAIEKVKLCLFKKTAAILQWSTAVL